ncbi:hypothetical protein FA95DRAFT_85874 [Auriscalpium vulgare]|uniref:Uncharacterized protein n=1 Tax=Auriscalpium vulgare TaxID=40419 RepID=A0ACB8RPL9_9AGAM|nr:hypothetical protein FA95DRAFT_85874 [Auriscalpium vulgare]
MYRPWNLFNHVPRPGPSNPPQEDAQPNEARVNKRQERPPTVQSTVPPRRVTNRGGQRGRGRGRGGGGAPENSLVHVYKAERGRARGRGAAAGRGAASSRGGHGDGQGSGSAAGPSNSGAPPAAAQSVHPLPLRPLAPFPAAPLQSAQVGSQASSLSFPLSNRESPIPSAIARVIYDFRHSALWPDHFLYAHSTFTCSKSAISSNILRVAGDAVSHSTLSHKHARKQFGGTAGGCDATTSKITPKPCGKQSAFDDGVSSLPIASV